MKNKKISPKCIYEEALIRSWHISKKDVSDHNQSCKHNGIIMKTHLFRNKKYIKTYFHSNPYSLTIHTNELPEEIDELSNDKINELCLNAFENKKHEFLYSKKEPIFHWPFESFESKYTENLIRTVSVSIEKSRDKLRKRGIIRIPDKIAKKIPNGGTNCDISFDEELGRVTITFEVEPTPKDY